MLQSIQLIHRCLYFGETFQQGPKCIPSKGIRKSKVVLDSKWKKENETKQKINKATINDTAYLLRWPKENMNKQNGNIYKID